MQSLHPAKNAVPYWNARKIALLNKIEIVSEYYHSTRGRNPTDLPYWEEILHNESVRKELRVVDMVEIEHTVSERVNKLNLFWL